MHKKIGVLSVFLLVFGFSYSQSSKIKGSVKDTVANIPVYNAVVALLTPKDSVLKSFTRTKPDGSFNLENIPQGKYIMMVMQPMFGDYVEDIEINTAEQTFPAIPLTSKSKLLAAIIIKSGSPIKIKGDTTIYTADSFNVSANANVEELLKKLPGITVDKNGEIKAMGEKVEKVLVDGEEFFGDDPGMAVKNLRADAVKEVQVFDKKSDQAEFTGIDDGKTQKTINLKLKEDKKTGYFGKIDIAGGLQKNIDDRYNGNLMFGTFKGKRKLAAFLLTGNTGQDGLSWEDSQKYGGGNDNFSMNLDDDGGGMMWMWNGGSADDEPYVNTEDGFIKNINAGLNYNNKWNDKQTLTFTPKYNEQDYTNTKKTLTQQQIENTTLNSVANDISNIKRNNFKTKLIYDVKIDSANTLKLTANANFYHNENEIISYSETNNTDATKINTRSAISRNNNDKYALAGNIIFKHKFKKARRTFSFTADWNQLNTDGINYSQSSNLVFLPTPDQQLIDQKVDVDKSTQKITSKLVYTEPLGKRHALEIGYQLSYNYGNNNQVTYIKPSVDAKEYNVQVDTLTNKFRTIILVNTPSVKLNYSYKKIKYNFGAGFGFTNYDLTDQTFNKDYTRNYTNFFPSAGFTYNYKSNHSFRINYTGSTSQPTVNQLQPLRNNNDKFNQYIGNPDLKPSFANSFNIQHNGYNFIKEMWMYQSLNITVTSNSFTNNIFIDTATGEKITQPVNTNGNVSMWLYAGIGKQRLKKLFNLGLNIGPYLNYTRTSNYLNSKKSISNILGSGLNVGVNKSKDKKYDFSVNNDIGFNNNKTTESPSDHYLTYTLNVNATVYYKKVWSLGSDFQFFARQKTGEFDNGINTSLWSAKLQRTFKNNEFTAYIKVRDILNQNIGIDRNFFGNTFTETQNDRLKRYFLVGFAWDFKNKAKKK
ncbi:MAG: outer membrane beta-barrel family protein [Ferruginibacter sp.]